MGVNVIDGEITSTLHTGLLDAFGTTRSATFMPITGWTFAYNVNAAMVKTDTDAATGSVTHSGNFAVLSTGTDAAGHAQIQTLKATRYVPGVGGLARFTARFTEPTADSQQLIGLFDNLNGWAFGYNGKMFGIMRRTGGVDTWYYRDFWNGNKFADIDPTKGNVYEIEYQWLGFGAQIFSIENEQGKIETVHTIGYAGQFEDTSIDNPNLPLTARVENDGNTTDMVLRTPSAIAGLDGDPLNSAISLQLATDVERAVGTSGTALPVMTIKNPTTWLSKNNYLPIQAMRFSFAAELNKPVIFRLFVGAAVTGGSYSDIATGLAPVQVNKDFTSATGGIQIGSLPIAKTGNGVIDLSGRLSLGYPGQELTILASTNGTGDVQAGLSMLQFL